eukprot:m51a1_g3093 hypothetical protein (285) ;mRNA; f:95221-96241
MSGRMDAARRALGMPRLVYGTAWKKDRTPEYVALAARAGFRGFDTACQPRHYREDLVGSALRSCGAIDDVWLQTKYTSKDGQDTSKPMPYDPAAPVRDQVRASVERSAENLRRPVECVLLHGPLRTEALTFEAWSALEDAQRAGYCKHIGLSNFYDQGPFDRLVRRATVKPVVLQNRFYAESRYDVELRQRCDELGIVYQSFWTLTGNPQMLKTEQLARAAQRLGATKEQAWFAFVMALGIVPLVGTCSEAHMLDDLKLLEPGMQMCREDVEALARLIGQDVVP